MSDLLKQYRAASPELANMSDDELIKVIHSVSGDQGSPYDYARSVLGYQDKGSRLKDFGIDVARSVGALGEMATGAIDLATGGYGSEAWRKTGRMDPVQEYKQNLAKGYSTKRNEAAYNIDAAEGFWNKLGAAAANPSVPIGMAVEQAPSILIPFGTAAKGAKLATKAASKVGPQTPKALRFADEVGRMAGETAGWTGVTAAQTAAQMQQVAPGDTDAMYEAAGLSALGTGAITAGFSFLPGGQMVKQAISGPRRYAAGTMNAAGQITGESVAQTAAVNYATGKPLTENMDEALALGLVSAPAFGALAARKRPDYAGAPPVARGSEAPFTTPELERTWRREAVQIMGDETLNVAPDGTAMNPQQFEAYRQFQQQEHPDIAEAPAAPPPAQLPPGQVQDPAAVANQEVLQQQGKQKPAKPEEPPPSQEELDALFAKIGAPELVPARRPDGSTIMNDDGKPLMVRHWDGSDKQKVPAPYTSPEKMAKAVQKAIQAEREKPEPIRKAEAYLAKVIKEELGRLPTSKELAMLVKETELDGIGGVGQEFSPTRLVHQIDIALQKMEGKKAPDAQFKRDALAAWKKAIEGEIKDMPKPEVPKGPQRAVAEVKPAEPPVEILAAIADTAAKPTITVKDNNGKVATLDPKEVMQRLQKMSPQQRRAIQLLLGVDQAGDAVGKPMPHAQVAKEVGVSRAAVTSWANKVGLTEEAISRFAAADLPTATKADEVQFMDNTETGEGSGFTVREGAGDLGKGGLLDSGRTAAQKRADAVANEFLAKNASKETPDIVTPKEAEIEQQIDAKRRAQAEVDKLKEQKRALETPYRAEAIREYNAMRSKKLGEKRFEELDEELQTEWVLLYDFNERSDIAGHADDVQDLFDDFKRENYDRLVRSGEPSADPAGPKALGGPEPEADVQPRPDQDGDAGTAQAGPAQSQAPEPRIVTRRKRVPIKPDDAQNALQRNEPGASYRTAFELEKELKLFMNASSLGKMVTITDSKGVDNIKGKGWAQQFPYVMGFATTEGKVVLIADRIPRGEGKGVFLHELGSHLGIDRMLPAQQRGEVARQIAEWARTDMGDTGKVASAAMARTANAEKESTVQRQETEVIAYFIEEALAHGVKPSIHGSGAARLLHKIKELFQNALRKIFGGRVAELTMQDLVDLAYGAAQRNISDKPIRQDIRHMDGVFDTTFGTRTTALDVREKEAAELKQVEGSLKAIEGLEEHFPDDYANLKGWKERITTRIDQIDRLFKPHSVGAVQFSQRRTIDQNVNRMPAPLRKPVRGIAAAVHDVTSRVGMAGAFMHDLADWGTKHGVPAMKKIADHMAIKGALKIKLDQDLGKLVKQLQDLPKDSQMKTQRFLLDSTLSQEWGYEPTWRPQVDVSPAAQAKWEKLSTEEQAVADAMLKHGWEMWKAKQDAIRDLAHAHYTEMVSDAERRGAPREEVDKIWAEMDKMVNKTTGLLKGPYVPLKRFGSHVVSVKSRELLDAIAQGGEFQDELMGNPDHYRVEFYESAYSAANREAELREQFPDHQVEMSRKEEHNYIGAGYDVLQRLSEQIKTRIGSDGEDGKVAQATYRALQEAIIESLGEVNTRSSQLQRKNVAGMNPMEIGRAFAAQGYADNRFLAGTKLNKEINDAMSEMRVQVKSGGDRTMKQHFYNELQKRRANALNVQMPSWAGHAMRFTTLWKLVTSPAYYLQYLTQPVTMFLPMVQGKHGYAKGVSAFIEGVKSVTKMHRGLDELDFSKIDNAEERAMLQQLRDNGTIQIGHEQMFGRVEMMPDNAFSETWQKVSDTVARIPHTVEAHNRAASALAAYRMERKAGASHEEAVKYVKDIILQSYGDYSSFNAPRMFQGGAITRMAMQYRQFQFIHTALLARIINNAFGGADAETKKAARLQLGYMAGHYGVLAGALGVPAAHVVGHAVRLTLGDEQDKDLETFVKRHVKDKTAQDMILGGVPRALLGQDLASRIGAGDILDPMRYGSVGGALSGKEGYKDFMTAAMGPFVGGLIPQVIDGVNTVADGDYYRGLEKLAPKGIADVMKAFRIADEGLVDNKGAQVADEIGTGDIIAKALGSNPVSIAGPSHDSYVASQVVRDFKDQANRLKSQFIRAQRNGEDVEEIVEDWKSLMARQKAAGIKPQTLADLYKAPREMAKREMRTVGGVQFRPGTEEMVRDITGGTTDEAEE